MSALDELRHHRTWVAWRSEQRPGDAKPAKVPKNPHTGGNASSTKPSTWGTHEQAVARAHKDGCDGVGYVFTREAGLTGIDLDDCLIDGNLTQWGARIIAELDTYTEISPSGRGVKLWARGQLPGNGINSQHIELYDRGRFFTFTGQHFPGTPQTINDRQEQIQALYHQTRAKGKPDSVGRSITTFQNSTGSHEPYTQAVLASEVAVLAQAPEGTRNDQLNRSAFRLGQFVGAGMLDRSEVETALQAQAMAIGLGAGETTKTIRSGLDAGVRQPRQIGAVGPATSLPPTIYANGTGQCGAPVAVAIPRTTHGANGRLFVTKHADKVVFNTTCSKWMVYDGTRWVIDEARIVQTLAKGIVMDLYAELATIQDEEVRKAMAAWARRCDSPTGTDAMLSEASNALNLTDVMLDTEPRLFNMSNGTLDLETGRLLPHDPGHKISKLAPIVYNPEATCPAYDQAIRDIFAGDHETVRFFEEAVGATLSGKASKNIIYMLGDMGDNGKSTVANLLLEMFGDYGTKGDLSLLVRNDRFDPQRATPTVVALKGRRLCIVQEVPKDRSMDEGQVKELTGRDVLTARRLHENPITFTPSHLLWVYGNHRLKIEDDIVFNRLYEIPFNVEFCEGDPRRDERMPEKLSAEKSGIFNRFLAGYQRYVANGEQLRPSHQVRAATASYKAESNVVLRYISERFVIMRDEYDNPDSAYSVGAADLFYGYEAFCAENDLKVEYTPNKFWRMLTRMGIPSDKARVASRMGLRRLTDEEIRVRDGIENRH